MTALIQVSCAAVMSEINCKLSSMKHLRCSTAPGLWFCGAGLSSLGLSPPSPAAAPSRSLHASGRTETLQFSPSGLFLCLDPACLLEKRLAVRVNTYRNSTLLPRSCVDQEVLQEHFRVTVTALSFDWRRASRAVASSLRRVGEQVCLMSTSNHLSFC